MTTKEIIMQKVWDYLLGSGAREMYLIKHEAPPPSSEVYILCFDTRGLMSYVFCGTCVGFTRVGTGGDARMILFFQEPNQGNEDIKLTSYPKYDSDKECVSIYVYLER